MYYLQSWYYDPATCIFLNYDTIFDYDANIPGYNLYVYCGNNPIRRIDISGADSIDLIDGDKEEEPEHKEGGGGNGYPSGGSGSEGYGQAGTASNWSHSSSNSNGANGGNSGTESLSGNWYQGTFQSAEDSMQYHYNKHVVQEGLSDTTSIEQYTQDALNFAQANSTVLCYQYNRKYGNASWNCKYSPGRGGYFTSSGKIITFWYRSIE